MSLSEEEATEKLEKLQQNITLTLQEIDHNFAKCNHIVTSGLLPELDRYRATIKEIWHSSKLWLCFFQALDHLPDTSNLHGMPKPSPFTFEAISKLYGDKSAWARLQRDLEETYGTSDISSIATKGLLRPAQQRAAPPHTTIHDEVMYMRKVQNEILHHTADMEDTDSPLPVATSLHMIDDDSISDLPPPENMHSDQPPPTT
ncbi:DASH complex subunit Ask1-domain-containing protein [Gongronella butleri]|nr:DASH complex subunit Ask1-domain-containing protein [Gongronella butleri]